MESEDEKTPRLEDAKFEYKIDPKKQDKNARSVNEKLA